MIISDLLSLSIQLMGTVPVFSLLYNRPVLLVFHGRQAGSLRYKNADEPSALPGNCGTFMLITNIAEIKRCDIVKIIF